MVISDLGQAWRYAGLSLVYAPAVLSVAGLAVLLTGWLPRTAKLAWVVVAFAFVIGWLGGLLQPPQWVENLSPLAHTPLVPVEPVALTAPSVTALVVVLLVAVGVLGLRRRDIG
jgi:ABC-2 type transport system permease protein